MGIYSNYNPAVDISILILCMMLYNIIKRTYVPDNIRFKYVKISILFLKLSCVLNIIYMEYCITTVGKLKNIHIYLTRGMYYILLIGMLAIFVLYIATLVDIKTKKFIRGLTILTIVSDIILFISPFFGFGFKISNNNEFYQNYFSDPFTFVYTTFVAILLILVLKNKKRFIQNIYRCICHTYALGTLIMIVQCVFEQTSFTTLTYFIQIFTVIILLHSNPYEANYNSAIYGSLNIDSFNSYYNDIKKQNGKNIILSIQVKDFSSEKYNRKIKSDFRNILRKLGYYNFSFRLNEDTVLFIIPSRKFDKALLESVFKEIHTDLKMDYKIIILNDTFENYKDLIDFHEFIKKIIPENTIHTYNEEDINIYTRNLFIKKQLQSIADDNNLNDERIKLYCQPILNLENNKYTSAEALMRIELEDIGMIYPDQFIPLAEEYGYIHKLSLIILNKTCQYLETQPKIDRISINFSMLEIIDNSFVDDIINIVSQYKIKPSQIAIEITESNNSQSFDSVKNIILKLKEYGFKIYLDDFGTGYSNFERIMELPIDIIKFDKSLVLMSKENNSSKYMIKNFSNIFKELGYSILFEGIEDLEDEAFCKEMKSDYGQGYLYSRPIPIKNLQNFLYKNKPQVNT